MIRLWTKVAGAWKTVANVYVKVGGVWKEVTQAYTKDSGTWKQTFGKVELQITSNTANYNLFTTLGSPAYPIWVDVTINSGIIISSTSSSNPSFDTGAMPAGSRIRIINNGQIIGKGGTGGAGGHITSDSNWNTLDSPSHAPSGGAGGDAISILLPIVLDNTNGDIFGGGGGGGAGGIMSADFNSGGDNESRSVLGGGGGGGAGDAGGSAGARSTSDTNQIVAVHWGTNGSSGDLTGGSGGNYGCHPDDCVNNRGGVGGAGGNYGVNGSGGQTAYKKFDYGINYGNAGSGGLAGKAVDLNGNSITWLGGNNSTQVKGAQS